jgi:excisionase family DNA binding protein
MEKTVFPHPTLNAQQAAARLGAHPKTVLDWIHSKELKGAKKVGREWLVPVTEVERKAKEWQHLPELEVVHAAGDAAKYLAGWYDSNILTTTAQVIHACKLVAESFADLKQRKDTHAANVVLGERLETFNRLVADVAEAVAHLEGIKALRSVVVDAQGDASRLAREWDKRTHAARQQIKRRIASTK